MLEPNIKDSLSEIVILKVIDGQEPEVLTIEFGKYLNDHSNSYKDDILKFIGEDYVFVYDLKRSATLKNLLQEDFSLLVYIDVCELLTIFYPSLGNNQLKKVIRILDIDEEADDCSEKYREVKLICSIIQKCWYKGLNMDLGHLHKLEEAAKCLSSQLFIRSIRKEVEKNYVEGIYKPGPNLADGINLFKKEPENRQQEIELNSEWVVDTFRGNGLLSEKLPGFEVRSSQILMVEAILKGFTESVNTIIEAGTGTGKSISYLIPALWWSRKHRQRVVVATHTINLQEQLFFKDLPFLEKILPFSFKAQLLKGKGNYLCLKEFYREKWKNELKTKEENLVYASILTWIKETLTGDLSEIAALKDFYFLKNKFGAEGIDCQPRECYYAKECFLLKARKLADEADLVIVNHSLLLADIKANHKVIPEYNYLIIDEAHNLYHAALKQLSFELSLEKIITPINKLLTDKGSTILYLKKNLPLWSEVFSLIKWEDILKALNDLTIEGNELIIKSKELFIQFSNILEGCNTQSINQKYLDDNTNNALKIMIENLLFQLNSITDILSKMTSCFSLGNEQFLDFINEINKIKNEFADISLGLKAICSAKEEDRVTYLEKSTNIFLKSVRVDIASILKEKIFDLKYCTILTSATLTIEDSFEFIARDIGLEKYNSLKLDTVFDFNKQMLLTIVNDIPISRLSEEALVKKSANFIGRVVEILAGRTLVLFTSYRHLRLVSKELKPYLINYNIRTYVQGVDGTREQILREFTNDSKSVLLGTNSFWEGIDLPGENLKCVIITRLPFWPPDNPIIEAKANLLAQEGRKPFEELHLPEAIIRFKQGFGRLIRNKSDNGVVIILDDRLVTKSYGNRFLKSLPISSYFQGNSHEVLNQVRGWIK